MPAYKDELRNTWFVKFYYQTWDGERRTKKKRGFQKKKDALEWERMFLDRQQAQPDMSFSSLMQIYLEDMSHRIKVSTMHTKTSMLNNHVQPFFSAYKINEIYPQDIRKWQNKLLDSKLSQTYIKQLGNQLSAIMNYDVRYYGLNENPCIKAGSVGSSKADEMLFWTKDEYYLFRDQIKDRIMSLTAFDILYFTGIRFGELVALTKQDILIDSLAIDINKTLSRIKKVDYITEPKTKKSKRIIPIPEQLASRIKLYMDSLYDLNDEDRLFTFTNKYLYGEMLRGCKLSKNKKIRIHDLRHSHASLLIDLGFSPILIAERLGHEKVETTLNTYAHLYPSKQDELVSKLEQIFSPKIVPF